MLVKDVMHTEVITVKPSLDIVQLMKLFREYHFHRFPVVDEERDQELRVPPERIDVIARFTIDSRNPVVVLIDMEPDWIAISKSGNLRPVLKATVSQEPPADAEIETINSTEGEGTE